MKKKLAVLIFANSFLTLDKETVFVWFKCSRVKYLNAKSLILGRQQTLYCATKKWDCSE